MKEADVLLDKAKKLTAEALAIMQKKNHDYTSGSGDPYANFRMAGSLGVHPAVGICIRTGDKLQRIRTFAERGQLKVDGEGLKDACLDVINYAILAYALLTEEQDKPNEAVEMETGSILYGNEWVTPAEAARRAAAKDQADMNFHHDQGYR